MAPRFRTHVAAALAAALCWCGLPAHAAGPTPPAGFAPPAGFSTPAGFTAPAGSAKAHTPLGPVTRAPGVQGSVSRGRTGAPGSVAPPVSSGSPGPAGFRHLINLPALTGLVASPGPRGVGHRLADPSSEQLAGRLAGVGRTRPGRAPDPEEVHPFRVSVPQAPPVRRLPKTRPSAPVTPHTTRPTRRSHPSDEPQAVPPLRTFDIRPLPLGTGIALVGLGLGFLALRLRRTG
ncbi:hypothetical protein HNQ79_003849 [Streptomyces candidus]|uniref:Uncharacterized protein n=1 Tax=Streptomyces candidus TaxID=67283 RepID=A0A7X0HGZ6_9ACTN|nr:hypothetical protein [Streptomyces candidus]GHH38752.1 hypothetical protein GCM10018773_17430 [Streptomyces candidus]